MKTKIVTFFTILFLFIFSGSVFPQELTKEEKRSKKKEARKLLKNSLDLVESEQLDSALIVLDSLIILDSKNPDAYYQKGWIFAQKADSAGAITILEQGVQKAPLSTRLKILLARLKIDTGDIDGAISLLDFILSIKPREGEALYLKGLTLLEKDEKAKAIEAFNKALESTLKKGSK